MTFEVGASYEAPGDERVKYIFCRSGKKNSKLLFESTIKGIQVS